MLYGVRKRRNWNLGSGRSPAKVLSRRPALVVRECGRGPGSRGMGQSWYAVLCLMHVRSTVSPRRAGGVPRYLSGNPRGPLVEAGGLGSAGEGQSLGTAFAQRGSQTRARAGMGPGLCQGTRKPFSTAGGCPPSMHQSPYELMRVLLLLPVASFLVSTVLSDCSLLIVKHTSKGDLSVAMAARSMNRKCTIHTRWISR